MAGVCAGLPRLQHTPLLYGFLVSSAPDKPLILCLLDAFRLALLDHDHDLSKSTTARGYCHHCGLDAGYHFVSQQRRVVVHVFIIPQLNRYVNRQSHG